jgi:isopentenyl diphosphate isomerase/L-lactate dehydrogenase-like FMN-dependent dehydrogenase
VVRTRVPQAPCGCFGDAEPVTRGAVARAALSGAGTATTVPLLSVLAAAVSGRVPLLVDSGFRRGTDVLKAVALGADAVLLGRPVVWALAVGGEQGVVDAVGLLVQELRIAMQTCGCASLTGLRRDAAAIIRGGDPPDRR